MALQMTGFHYKARAHSTHGNVEVLKAACRQEMWINPIGARKRGISNGDMVKIFNGRGEVRINAKVTPPAKRPGSKHVIGRAFFTDKKISADLP